MKKKKGTTKPKPETKKLKGDWPKINPRKARVDDFQDEPEDEPLHNNGDLDDYDGAFAD